MLGIRTVFPVYASFLMIRSFAEKNYKNVIEINFITEPSYKVIVEEGFSAEHIIKLISRIDPTKHFEENETLIFFDETQDP